MEFIVHHPAYKGIPFDRKPNNSINWVTPANSKMGKARHQWWDSKRNELGLPKEGKWISEVAKKIHPTGKKPCQICGEVMEIAYVYPHKKILEAINRFDETKNLFDVYDSIKTILIEGTKISDNLFLDQIQKIFKIPSGIQKTTESYLDFILTKKNNCLSPGAMSNAPDRLDGFHTYNLCCRKEQDTGRHADNLSRYGQDRRAYEVWAEGDWKAAERLMRVFNHHGVSADHIGPISLGFCHRPRFQPLSKEANSAKNNRMSFEDVKKLLEDEKNGETVVSWHSKFIWDKLKNEVKNGNDAKELSKLMRKNLNFVLTIFARIAKAGGKKFLAKNFLHPEYSFFDIEFTNFNPQTGTFEQMVKKEGDMKQYQNNADRYLRISFDSLQEYMDTKNRKVSLWEDTEIEKHIHAAIELLSSNEAAVRSHLEKILIRLTDLAAEEFKQARN
jgi:Alw26I/Eco31I/Esp3I family type II restriction endonuclease